MMKLSMNEYIKKTGNYHTFSEVPKVSREKKPEKLGELPKITSFRG